MDAQRDAEPWETAAAPVRAAQGGDALAMDELPALVTPYATRTAPPRPPRLRHARGCTGGTRSRGDR